MRPIEVSVGLVVDSPIKTCFEYIVPIELAHIFRATLIIPGVVRTDESQLWHTPGMSRTVYFSDGSQATERLLTVDSPHAFSYKIDAFTGFNKHLVSQIEGSWHFNVEADGRTRIRWSYNLLCHSNFTRMITRILVVPFLHSYLQGALEILKQDLESNPQVVNKNSHI